MGDAIAALAAELQITNIKSCGEFAKATVICDKMEDDSCSYEGKRINVCSGGPVGTTICCESCAQAKKDGFPNEGPLLAYSLPESSRGKANLDWAQEVWQNVILMSVEATRRAAIKQSQGGVL